MKAIKRGIYSLVFVIVFVYLLMEKSEEPISFLYANF